MVDDRQLRLWGKQAAANFLGKSLEHNLTGQGTQMTLSEAVAEVLKKEASDLTSHQIDRVCEAANHAAWQHVFAGSDKTAGFQTALGEIVRGKMKESEKTASSAAPFHYSGFLKSPLRAFQGAPVRYHKMDKEAAAEFQKFHTKQASSSSPTAKFMKQYAIDPYLPLQELWSDLEQFKIKIASDLRAAKARYDDFSVKFCNEAITAFYEKLPFNKIAAAIKQMPAPDAWKKTACVDLLGGVWARLSRYNGDLEEIYDRSSMTKTAQPNHPLMQAFLGMVKSASDFIAADKMWREEVAPIAIKTHQDLTKTASFRDAAKGLLQGAGNVIGGGAQLAGHGLNRVGQLAIDHPLAALTTIGAGYFFGKPALDYATDYALHMRDKINSGLKRPQDEFSSYPSEIPLDEVYG